MSELPSGWVYTTLGDASTPVRGVTYRKDQARAQIQDGYVPLLRATNIGKGLALESDLIFIPDAVVKPDQYMRVGDVVVAASSGSASVVGKSAELRLEWRGTFGAFCMVLRPSELLEPSFLAHYVGSPSVRQRWSALAAGTNINNLKRGDIADTPLPLPPLNEQRRIVAAIEEQLSRLDAADASLVALPRRLDMLRSAVTTELVEGSWPRVAWKTVGRSQNGRAFPSRDYSETGIKLLRPGNLHVSGRVAWDAKNTRHLPETYASEHPSFVVGGNELVMNLTAQSLKDEFLGRICLTGQAERCLLNQRIARLTPNDADPRFVMYAFKSRRFRAFVNGLNTGSLIQHMFTSQLAEYELALPPLEDQKRIVAEVEERLSAIDALRAAIERAQRRSAALRRAVLERAFRGELVPQDPSDEPASVLLERVRAERAAASPPSRRRRVSA